MNATMESLKLMFQHKNPTIGKLKNNMKDSKLELNNTNLRQEKSLINFNRKIWSL
jgi:hypothetical protein